MSLRCKTRRERFYSLAFWLLLMPHQVCTRCQRANPGEAVYCYYDGIPLGHNGASVSGALPQEFVFKSGRRCRTFDELVQACYQEWDDARDLLRRGEFARFLTRAGRADLARAAQEAQKQPDGDIALVNFISGLPAVQTQQPRLDLNPRRLMLGVLRPGETRPLKITVSNKGQGILQGKVAVSEGGEWLKIAESGSDRHCAIRTNRDQIVNLRLQTVGLVPRTYSAKLTVITNGGIAEVPVRLDITAVPFEQAPFRGAATPRDLAEKMRTNPKAAAPLLVNGEVARWFTANGWAYPVVGPPAPGVAAVQQFFECMGLSKPPPLQLSPRAFNFLIVPPELQRGQMTLHTTAKKWVYAQADSDKPWLRVTTPVAGGPQQAQFAFEIDSSLMEDNKLHEGTLQLIANAGQKLTVRVVVEVRRPQESLTRRLLRPFFVMTFLFLMLRLLLIGPADLLARLLLGEATGGGLERWLTAATSEDAYLRVFVLATWWLGSLVGVIVVAQRQGRWTDYFCGLVAGTGAGMAGSATLGCLLSAGDAVPRFLLSFVPFPEKLASLPWLMTPLWLVLVTLWWTMLGALLGLLLTPFGRYGSRVVDIFAAPVAWLLRLCGLKRLGGLFSTGTG